MSKRDRILVTAYSEHCAGPGWANTIYHLIYRAPSGAMTVETLQQDAVSLEIIRLCEIEAVVRRMIVDAFERTA